MLGIKVCPVNDAFVMENAIAELANLVQIALTFLAFVKTLRQVGEDGFEGPGKEGSLLFIVCLEEADPESELKFRHDTPGRDGFAGFRELGFGLGDFTRSPWSEDEPRVVIPIDPPHQEGYVPVNGIAKGDFAKLERGVEALA